MQRVLRALNTSKNLSQQGHEHWRTSRRCHRAHRERSPLVKTNRHRLSRKLRICSPIPAGPNPALPLFRVPHLLWSPGGPPPLEVGEAGCPTSFGGRVAHLLWRWGRR